MEAQKAQKIEEIRECYKTVIDNVKNELHNANILTNENLRNILFAKEIENFKKIKNENQQVQNLNDYIVSNIIDRIVNEIYRQITTNNYSFDDFSLYTEKKDFFQLKFKIKRYVMKMT